MTTTYNATDRLHIGNEWIGHKGLDIYDNTARMHDPLLGRYHTVDPLFAEYPGQSPWSHCAANPINTIDPTGMDNWQLDDRGYFSLVEQTEDDFDVILGREGASIQVEKRFLRPLKESSYTAIDSEGEILELDVTLYTGQSANREVFEFLSANSNVEWSILYSNKYTNIIGTSHNATHDSSPADVLNSCPTFISTITRFDHSHLTEGYASIKDYFFTDNFPNNKYMEFNIYYVPKKEYVKYSSSGIELREYECVGKKP